MKFKSYDGQDVTLQEICDLIEDSSFYEVWIGSDSYVRNAIKKVQYSTCIVLYKQGKGGRIFISKSMEPMVDSLRQRLMNEVWMSLETCFEFKELLPSNTEIVVDLDINKSRKHKSGNYCEELVGMVVGQGFKCRVKPDAWAAQSAADRFSKK